MMGLTLLLPLVTVGTSHADDGSDAAKQAAKEIADARDSANLAADQLFEAESHLDTLQVRQAELVGQVAAIQQRIDKLRVIVENVAINRFTRSGTNSLPLLTGFRSAGEQSQVSVLIDVANETSAEDFDQLEAFTADLAVKQQQVVDEQVQTEAAKATLQQRRTDATAEVAHLKVVEADRLKDEAVKQALVVEEAERHRQQVAQQKADLLAAAQASEPSIPKNSSSRPGGDETAPTDGGASDGDVGSQVAPNGPTGGTGGGQTGVGGIGGRPSGLPGGIGGDDYGSPTWVCPVQGAVGFGDTWGAPRSGGRLHKGVDMIGERGLPVVAVVDGFAQQKVNELGGNTISFTGSDGNRYYYAHLDGWALLGEVKAGDVIGYVGQTGNAQSSVPHLHFEIHPGGGEAVDPYPTVRAHC